MIWIGVSWRLNLGEIMQNLVLMLCNFIQASYQQKSFYGFGSGPNSYNSGYLPSGLNQGSSFGGASISSLRANGRNWLSLENSRRYLKGSGSLCSCNGTPDILSEQNRGPRALKPKSQITAENLTLDNSERSTATPKIHDDLHNRPDFVTEYKEAKFFIIKSYSEDNVHKSIKYGVWASTANGNRKLDAAYHEAQEKQYICPVFLLFSVHIWWSSSQNDKKIAWYLFWLYLCNHYSQVGQVDNHVR